MPGGIDSGLFLDKLVDIFNTEARLNPRASIIFGQSFIEIAVNSFIDEYFDHPAMIRNKNFSPKIDMLLACGVIKDDSYKNLKIMYEIRNNYLHVKDIERFNPDVEFIKEKMLQLKLRRTTNSPIALFQASNPELTEEQKLGEQIKMNIISIMLDQLQEDFSNALDRKFHITKLE